MGLTWYGYSNFGWLLATPEKALCDIVYKRKKMITVEEMTGFLKDGMRIDMDELAELNVDFRLMDEIVSKYQNQNVTLLARVIRKELL